MVARFTFRLFTIFCLAALITTSIGSAVQAASPASVTIGKQPRGFMQIGSTIFFTAVIDGPQGSGFELWRTNGYGLGTQLVKDINPGGMSAFVLPPNFMSGFYDPLNVQFIELNGIAYFWANDGTHGYELWRSDGTVSGTYLVKDTQTGVNGVVPADSTSLPKLFRANNLIFFGAKTSGGLYQLWRSDGTNVGTFLLVDNYQGFYTSVGFQELNGQIFFNAQNGLWKTDGTTANTVLVKSLWAGSPYKVGSFLYFGAVASGGGSNSLWKSDGTEVGTVEVPGGNVASQCPQNNYIYYMASTTTHVYFNSGCGYLWASDGLTTTLVSTYTIIAKEFASKDNKLFITFENNGLWQSNGTAASTIPIGPTRTDGSSYSPVYPMVVGNQVFFRGSSAQYGNELWKANETLTDTLMVRDIFTGTSSAHPRYLGEAGGILYFSATASGSPEEAWRSDGTITGTMRLRDVQWPYQIYLPSITK